MGFLAISVVFMFPFLSWGSDDDPEEKKLSWLAVGLDWTMWWGWSFPQIAPQELLSVSQMGTDGKQ